MDTRTFHPYDLSWFQKKYRNNMLTMLRRYIKKIYSDYLVNPPGKGVLGGDIGRHLLVLPVNEIYDWLKKSQTWLKHNTIFLVVLISTYMWNAVNSIKIGKPDCRIKPVLR